jgi:SPX domain protein involved in polyphosphate accumulation
MSSPLRYEVKYAIDKALLDQVLLTIDHSPLLFEAKYAPRKIHNIYFDTASLEAYADNIRGISYRTKLRLRGYDDVTNTEYFFLEAKKKHNKLGTKKIRRISNHKNIFEQAQKSMTPLLRQVDDPEMRTLMRYYDQPTLYNRYDRMYFESRLHPVRVTIDQNLYFQRLMMLDRPSFWNNEKIIVECKFPEKAISEGRSFIEEWMFRPSRFSKYVTGVLRDPVFED